MTKILTKREKMIFYGGSAMIILWLAHNYFVLPLLQKNSLINHEVYLTQVKLKKYRQLLRQKEELKKAWGQESGDLQGGPLQGEPQERLLRELEGRSRQAGVRILDLRPQAPAASSRSAEAGVILKTEGGMEGIIKFIYTIENSPSLLKIKKMRLNIKPNAQTIEGIFSIVQMSVV